MSYLECPFYKHIYIPNFVALVCSENLFWLSLIFVTLKYLVIVFYGRSCISDFLCLRCTYISGIFYMIINFCRWPYISVYYQTCWLPINFFYVAPHNNRKQRHKHVHDVTSLQPIWYESCALTRAVRDLRGLRALSTR